MNRFILILQFLTRITIKKDIKFDPDMGKGIVYFPIVGFIIGIIATFFGYLTATKISIELGAYVWVITEVIITGGLHLDGLGDSFDGLFSYRKKEKILEIMKDSRVGINALLVIVFTIILKINLVKFMMENNLILELFLVPMVGRLAGVFITYKAKTPRENGMGNLFIGVTTKKDFLMCLFYTMLTIGFINFLFSYLFAAQFLIIQFMILEVSLVLVLIFTKLLKKVSYSKIDGITGDVIGCSIELGELAYLLFIAILI